MPLTDYIPDQVLHKEGYVCIQSDPKVLRDFGFIHKDELESVRLSVNGIAKFLGVGESRVRRFIKWKSINLCDDRRMSLRQILETDWTQLTDLGHGDKKRKKTTLL